MEIISKFTVGSDQGIDYLFSVMRPYIRNRYQEIISPEKIEEYLAEYVEYKKMINVLNDLSTQLIMVFVDDEPVGYCLFKSGSSYSGSPEGKRMTEIIDFALLPEYDLPEVRQSLWNKSRSAITFTDSIWINTTENDPIVRFFKDLGFLFVKDTVLKNFSVPSGIFELELK
ncbi:hypothetical protein CEY12_20335 [Chryseobacterium sp. T16E-39]|uniref:hypothetical protein n=1 Tax=Chryseobacterium sp. T16E-39 TaxID=2015076 RepID=UPI000B5B1D17|nr:hypothetical protein [Chryseobacterium sp. T16E-39]ASK32288.1 hypothetical protein CEY12_20335 [Chryseobacterium sp. T16E-39]